MKTAKDDPIKLEESVIPMLQSELSHTGLKDYYHVFEENIASLINCKGLEIAQQKIFDFLSQVTPSKLPVFICQHVLGERLNFKDGIVFSPHASQINGFILIPHFNSIAGDFIDFIPVKKRAWIGTFIGDTNTNPLRKKIYDTLVGTKDWLINDTGVWHFSKSPDQREKDKESYINSLQNSIFCLCPPGTGAGTLRLWESISCGTIPVIFGNTLLPKELEPLAVRIDTIDSKDVFLQNLHERGTNVNFRAAQLYLKYWSNFANKKIYKNIVQFLDEKLRK
ncbi:MAG: exostosin family protein [Candidatus Riflebacteria bacterium]|nr:exostosin family protein [Candidatus Riflebacteria bacterium]